MQLAIENSKLSISFFQNDRWIISGKNNKIISTGSKPDDVKEFFWENGIFPGMTKKALENAAKIDFRFSEKTEFKKQNGANLFTDRGNRITFDREIVTDDDIRLALVHAQQKFGNEVTLTGDDPRFKQRMARIADDMGLSVLNPELQDTIEQHRLSKQNIVGNR